MGAPARQVIVRALAYHDEKRRHGEAPVAVGALLVVAGLGGVEGLARYPGGDDPRQFGGVFFRPGLGGPGLRGRVQGDQAGVGAAQQGGTVRPDVQAAEQAGELRDRHPGGNHPGETPVRCVVA